MGESIFFVGLTTSGDNFSHMVVHLPRQNIGGLERFEEGFALVQHPVIGYSISCPCSFVSSMFVPHSPKWLLSQRTMIKYILHWNRYAIFCSPFFQQSKQAFDGENIVIFSVLFPEFWECTGVKSLLWHRYCEPMPNTDIYGGG